MKYIVKAGDTLSKIAAQYLGSASKYWDIVNVNPSITDPDYIEVGQIIEIPDAISPPVSPTPTYASPQASVSSDNSFMKYIPYAVAAVVIGFLFMNLSNKKEIVKEEKTTT
jgi:LysM repeat protein